MLFYKVILILLSSYYCLGNRVKRVLNGARVVGREGPYDAVRYLVGIGSMHGVKWYTLGFRELLKYTGLYGTINCGGSLLTPALVQTACHCLASFDKHPSRRVPQISYHWEGVRVIYIGINDRFGEPFSMLTRPPVRSEKFFVSKACQKQPQPEATEADISFDFGIIKIDPGWIRGNIRVPTTNVKFAPIYKKDELTRIHDLFLLNQPVCLNIGFGNFDDEGHASDFIRSGWVHLMNEYWCRRYSCKDMTFDQMEEYKSWDCSDPFPKFYQPANKGDSGSPFTCNNAYFGVQSSYITLKGEKYKDYRVTTTEALIHSQYENTIEYRKALVQEISDKSKDIYVEIVKKFFKFFFPTWGVVLRGISQNNTFNTVTSSRSFSYETYIVSFSYIHVPPVYLIFLMLNVLLISWSHVRVFE